MAFWDPILGALVSGFANTQPASISGAGNPSSPGLHNQYYTNTSNDSLWQYISGSWVQLSIGSTTGTGSTVLSNSATLTSPTLTNPTVGTQASSNASTLAASTQFVATAVSNAISGINPAVAVQAATVSSSDTSAFTYNNGSSGVGATFTGTVNTAITIDGFTFTTLGQRLLVKNDTQSPSGAFNGIYSLTQLQTGSLAPVFTRATDYNQPSDINNTGAIPVINGTVNTTTTWLQTAQIVTVGTSSLSYTEFSVNPSSIPSVSNSTNFQKSLTSGVSALTIVAGAFATNAALGNTFTLTLVSGATTASAPTNPTDGQIITYRLLQPATGSAGTVTWNSIFDGGVTGLPVLSTTNGKLDRVSFAYDAILSKWCCLNGNGIGY